MIHMTNTWPLPPLLRATMTTVYSCPSVCPPHSKHRDPFLTTQLYLSFPQLRPPAPYPIHRAAGYLPWEPFPCQPPVHLLPCSVSPAHHLDLSHGPLKSISAWKPSRSLHTLASRAERTNYGSLSRKYLLSVGCLKKQLVDTLKRGRQRASHTVCSPRPRVLSPESVTGSLIRTPHGEEVPVPAPSSLPPAPTSTAWGQPFMLLPAGDSSPQTPRTASPQRPEAPAPVTGPLPWGAAHRLFCQHSRLRTLTPVLCAPIPGEAATFCVPLLLFSILQPLWFLAISVKKSSVISVVPAGPRLM